MVVETVGSAPIPGARITPSWDLAPIDAADDGTYALGDVSNPPTHPYDVTVTAPGYLGRKLWINWQRGSRTAVNLDLIRDAAPFSMEFYREFVRGMYDHPEGPYSVLRLPSNPTFYVKTVDETGQPLEPQVVTVIVEAIRRAVPPYSGGRFSAQIETGTAARARQTGYITVNVVRHPAEEEEDTCGLAWIGAEAGEITLNSDRCACGSTKVSGQTVMHEVGHAMGFFHVDDERSVMYPMVPGRCPSGEVSAAERYHASIAYSRPRGNTDPDDDPSSGPRVSTGDVLVVGIRVKN